MFYAFAIIDNGSATFKLLVAKQIPDRIEIEKDVTSTSAKYYKVLQNSYRSSVRLQHDVP